MCAHTQEQACMLFILFFNKEKEHKVGWEKRKISGRDWELDFGEDYDQNIMHENFK